MPQSTCSVPECGRPAQARTLCKTHHARLMRHGRVDPDVPVRALYEPGQACSIDECTKPASRRGWCTAHYKRFRRHGDPLGGRDTPAPLPKACHVKTCQRPPWARGYCKSHYQWWARGFTGTESTECTVCGNEVTGVRDGRATRKRRSDALMCGACKRPANPVTVGDLLARDGGDCGICAEAVEMDRRRPDPMSPSVDHVIPWSLGGSNEPDNCQLAHLVCNLRKNNRTDYAPTA